MGKELNIDPDLLAQAEAAGLRVTQVLESALRIELSKAARRAEDLRYVGLTDEEKAQKWGEENAEAIQAQKERIEAYGVFGEDLRTW
jgi:post-segregation antitoxin (ccd killing protein)